MKTHGAPMIMLVALGFWMLPAGTGWADTTEPQPILTAPANELLELKPPNERAESPGIADADVRLDTEPVVDHMVTEATPDGQGTRPLCGPAPNAINHVYCAEGYDSY